MHECTFVVSGIPSSISHGRLQWDSTKERQEKVLPLLKTPPSNNKCPEISVCAINIVHWRYVQNFTTCVVAPAEESKYETAEGRECREALEVGFGTTIC